MSKKTWIIFVVICVALIGTLIFISRSQKIDVSGVDINKILPAVSESGNIADHVYGKTDSKVLLVEYGDFQCPYCGQAYPKVKTVTTAYKDKIAFVFRNNPLVTLHPNARSAAAAAEAAGLQGKYWEMNDQLYQQQTAWSDLTTNERTTTFANYAKAIGVKDIAKFTSDMASNAVNSKINYDLSLGAKASVSGTPTFVVNGTKVSDNVAASVISGDGSALRKVLDEALK